MTVSTRIVLLGMAACLLVPCLAYAGSHPTRVDENTNCLECHADLATGDHVHPAVKLGCASCHSIENREDVSYVVLKPAKTIVCFECHQPETFSIPSLPLRFRGLPAVPQSARFGESSPAAGQRE